MNDRNEQIKLDWYLAGTFQDIEKNQNTNITQRGVYLWCLSRKAEEYHIIYVGKADDILARLLQEKKELCSKRSMLVSLSHHDCILKYIPNYDKDPEKKLIEENLRSINIFYAPLNDSVSATPEEVEGAIQIHLRRNCGTRQYLLTGVSNYNLREFSIENNLIDTSLTILGLDKVIKHS